MAAADQLSRTEMFPPPRKKSCMKPCKCNSSIAIVTMCHYLLLRDCLLLLSAGNWSRSQGSARAVGGEWWVWDSDLCHSPDRKTLHM